MLPLYRLSSFFACLGMTILLAATLADAGMNKATATDRDGRLVHHGQTRAYSAHIPDRHSPSSGFPLLLVFHGGGQHGAAMRRITDFDALADSRGFVVVYPDGIDKHWNDGRSTIKNPQDDVGFVAALIDQLASTTALDQRRIFATGLSNGALFTERLACDLAGRIAGIAPVAGTLPTDTARRCRPARPVAVLQIDGTNDPIMPYQGGKVADFGGRGQGGNVLSVEATAKFWAGRNGCRLVSDETMLRPVRPFDRTRIEQQNFAGCPRSAPVRVLTVLNGGHTWPGGPQYAPILSVGPTSRQIDASHAIIDFLFGLPLR